MNIRTSTSQLSVDPAAGRLPSPVAEWPISEANFRRLVIRWRSAHLWLSLWNADGRMISCDEEAGPFWNALRSRADGFRKAISAFVRTSMDEDTVGLDEKGSTPGNAGPWPNEIGLIAVPIRARRRCIGSLLAAFALRDEAGEDIIRLFNQSGLEQAAMEHFLRQAGKISPDRRSEITDLLSLTVEQAREIDTRNIEIASLTQNLENTYEELHLIYEISRRMEIPQEPMRMLQRVGMEIREASRARGIAFVLTQHAPLAGSSAHQDADQIQPLESRVIQLGNAAPDLAHIERLADCLADEIDKTTDHLLLNKASHRPELQWAEPWLQHLLVLPIREKDRLFGIMFGINCTDSGDYTSIDIQLLRAVADRVAAALQNQNLYDELADLFMGLLFAVVNSVDAKDPYTFGHSERVAHFSRALADTTGLSRIECDRVYLAGLLHDVGKIGVPDAILSKSGKLTDEEFDTLKKHPEIGEKILCHIRQVRDLIPGVMHHHERMDGRGYPHRLAGRDIPLLGRIICLADSFDAMTSNRTYRAAMPVALAVAEIRRCSGNQFDPQLAEKFLGIDLDTLYREANAYTGGDPNMGRIGALCSVLSRHPESWG